MSLRFSVSYGTQAAYVSVAWFDRPRVPNKLLTLGKPVNKFASLPGGRAESADYLFTSFNPKANTSKFQSAHGTPSHQISIIVPSYEPSFDISTN